MTTTTAAGSSPPTARAGAQAAFVGTSEIEGVKTGEIMGGDAPVPRMFSIEDPDGNHIWVVQAA